MADHIIIAFRVLPRRDTPRIRVRCELYRHTDLLPPHMGVVVPDRPHGVLLHTALLPPDVPPPHMDGGLRILQWRTPPRNIAMAP